VLRDKGERTRQRLDPLGMVTLGLGLFGVLWAITKLGNEPFDASTAGYLIGGVVLIGVFALIESRVAAPMLPLRIFKVPTMAASLCASLFQGLASFAMLTTGLHAAFYESVSFMVIAAILSAIRGSGKRKAATASRS
jgi:hypothetical protein